VGVNVKVGVRVNVALAVEVTEAVRVRVAVSVGGSVGTSVLVEIDTEGALGVLVKTVTPGSGWQAVRQSVIMRKAKVKCGVRIRHKKPPTCWRRRISKLYHAAVR
jgi:hypothetical protein